MTPEDFRKHGHALVDWIADYRANVHALPVMSRVAPGDVRRALPRTPPETPEPFDEVMRDLEETIVPGLSHWTHPQFFGYFPSNSDLASVLADLTSSGLGVLGVSWQASPALTELEDVTTDWLRQMVGLSDAWSGVIQDTASTSTLVALICARERALAAAVPGGAQFTGSAPLVVYASEHSHSSVAKAVRLGGFGAGHLRTIAVDADGRMRVDALEAAVTADRQAGRVPCAIVATVGTTLTTAVDPLRAVVDVIARARQAVGAAGPEIWLHVDAAMTGSAMILPECRSMWDGIEQADSVVINPHKWLGAGFDCSVYYVRDPATLLTVMATSPSYLTSSTDATARNLRDWGLPLGRRFRALKLWYLIRDQGVAGLAARLRRDLVNARWLEAQVRTEAGWRVLAPVILQTLCVQHVPPGARGDALDAHTLDWVERVNRSGQAYITPAILDGRWMARLSIGALTTEREHVACLWATVQDAARASAQERFA
ncbi:MAG: pyridoxal-dependent decarboxylase [Vicinamibacterales bacterium]